jgi:hypothetical protein
MPHIIRLRGPWERQLLPQGSARYTRRFHQPTGLDAESRVWLAIENFAAGASVTVNDCLCTPLPAHGAEAAPDEPRVAARFDITPLLQAQNNVAIDVASPLLGDVRLEIE